MQASDLPDATVSPDIKRGTVSATVMSISPDVELSGLTIHGSTPSPEPIEISECAPYKPVHPPRRNHHRAPSPTGSARSSFSSRRHVSRRFSGSSFMRSHRSEVCKELTVQAESEFFALMELMSSISRRSMSLKEVWSKITSERESCLLEMVRMSEQYEEFTEIIERKEREHHHHGHEHEETKKEVTRLRVEITAAAASAAEYKRKLCDRDNELGGVRREVHELRETLSRVREEREETRALLEETRLSLTACEEERECARRDAGRHHGDLRAANQKYAELQASFSELTSRHESTHRELVSARQCISTFELEQHEWLHEKEELTEKLRKCNHRCDDYSHTVEEMKIKYEKKVREVLQLKEVITELECERDELRRRVDEKHCKWEDAEDRCGKWKSKYEHSEREVISIREQLRVAETERTELHESLTKIREEMRVLVIEKQRVCDDHHHECTRSEERHRKIIVLQESLRRVESSLKEKSEAVHSLTERLERVVCERDEAQSRCADLAIEIEHFEASIVSLKAEIVVVTEKHDGACEKLRECEARYETVCESVTEYHEGHSEFEYELTTLRTMLRDARDQKEKAIVARNAADHERDEAVALYEKKCRELERYEEQVSHHLHSHTHSHSHGRSETRRTVSRSGYEASIVEASNFSEVPSIAEVATMAEVSY